MSNEKTPRQRLSRVKALLALALLSASLLGAPGARAETKKLDIKLAWENAPHDLDVEAAQVAQFRVMNNGDTVVSGNILFERYSRIVFYTLSVFSAEGSARCAAGADRRDDFVSMSCSPGETLWLIRGFKLPGESIALSLMYESLPEPKKGAKEVLQ